jgi:hypothetical protein
MRLPVLLALLAAHAGPNGTPEARTDSTNLPSQDVPLLAVAYEPQNGFRPVVRVGPVLGGDQLEQAARSGLPVRVRVRVELWRARFIDQLVDGTTWSSVIVYEPMGEQFFVRTLPARGGARRFPDFASARAAVEHEYTLALRPPAAGRYYYTATLQVETLSLSDLEELERWLQGELQPAVRGQRSLPAAVGQGARRLMLRILDLPQRRVDARTDRFRVP